MRELQALDDRHDAVRPAVPIVVGQRNDAARARDRDQERAAGVERQEAGVAEVAGEEIDREAGREPDRREVSGRRGLWQDPHAARQRQHRPAHPAGSAQAGLGIDPTARRDAESITVLPIRDATRRRRRPPLRLLWPEPAAALLQCRPMTTAPPIPSRSIVEDRARARAAGDPLRGPLRAGDRRRRQDGSPPGVRPIVLRDVGPQGIGLLISRTSPKWEPLSSGRYELLLLWLTIRRQYRVRGADGAHARDPRRDVLGPEGPRVAPARSLLRDLRGPVDRGTVARAVSRRDRSAAPAIPPSEAVPRPELLRGVYLVPERIEAWRGSPDRLHDRRRFAREGDEWREETLVP